MARFAKSLIATVLVVGGASVAAEKPEPRLATSDRTARVKAVLFAASQPVFLEVQVRVDGESPGRFRERFCDYLFAQLDQNKNRILSKSEVAKFLTQFGEQIESTKPATWDQLDVDPANGKVTPQKFRAFIERQLGPPLLLVGKKQPGEEGSNLFNHLDLNEDGALSADELRNAAQTLGPLDADDDETISAAELNATLDKPFRRTSEPSGVAPVIAFVFDPDDQAIAKRLLQLYASVAKETGDRSINVAALGLSQDAIRTFDRNGDGKLGVSELARPIAETPPKLTLSFELFDKKRGRPRVTVAWSDQTTDFKLQQPSADAATLIVNGMPFTLTAKRTHASTGDTGSFYALRFNVVDKDKNNYLDKTEFPALGLQNAGFGAVDGNGDGQIVRQELTDYLKSKGSAPVNQVLFAVSDESKSLFEFLDTRADGRLSPREMNAAVVRTKELDRDKDGLITRGELRTRISVEVEIKSPAGQRPARLVRAPRGPASAPAVPRDRGPEWFLRMDRNYDGDVSWREFLGSRQTFDRLDADHDGLLSPDEAEHAK